MVAEKCRCPSRTHGHEPGKCTNLVSEPGLMCKSCYDKEKAGLDRTAAITGDEAALNMVLDDFLRAIHDKDALGVLAALSEDAVAFDLAPPLQLGPEIMHDLRRLEEWFATWKGPIVTEPLDRKIECDGAVAYAHSLQCMTGTKIEGENVDLWFRATACFRKGDRGWLITHMHNSVPFAMDGTQKALLNLKPNHV